MKMGEHGHRLETVLALALLGAGCGARSDLLEQLQTETSGVGSGGGGFAGRGGNVGQGGTFSAGGKLGGGGAPIVAGTPGIAGSGAGGEPSACQLSLQDCATPGEPTCKGERAACSGTVAHYARFDSTQESHVNDVAVGRDDHIAITGFHTGTTTLGSFEVTVSPSLLAGQQAFVASFDEKRSVEWVYVDEGLVSTQGISLELAPNGDAVMQARHLYTSSTGASLMRLTSSGLTQWREDWGPGGDRLVPTSLGMDNDGRVWAGGFFQGELRYPGSALTSKIEGEGYLLQADGEGRLLQAFRALPSGWYRGAVESIAVDDEDSVFAVGRGEDEKHVYASFLQKFSASEEPAWEILYPSPLALTSVVVDRLMRVTVVGSFDSSFEYGNAHFQSTGNDLWMAQYSRDGVLLWQKSCAGRAYPDAVAVDAFGNLIVAGHGTRLLVDGQELVSPQSANKTFAFALKLRDSGADVWARKMDGEVLWEAAKTNSAGQIWLAGAFIDAISLDDDTLLSSPRYTGLLVLLNP